ncbi:unnamed protein product [Ectocarpus sp. CCAP 1310/34]|nr:unnamed protein product [Ectocarpus sp. CCAP 1310/34]
MFKLVGLLLLCAVRHFRLENIVENPDEALATDNKKGYAMRQASAILTFVSLEIADGLHPIKHSEVAALPVGVTGKVVRAWVRDFVNGKRFKVRVRDLAARNLLSVINDEDFREESREWLDAKIYGRKEGEPQLRVRDLQKWLQDLGFRWRRHRKCVNADGHNRPDNIRRRMGYVTEMQEHQKRTVKCVLNLWCDWVCNVSDFV